MPLSCCILFPWILFFLVGLYLLGANCPFPLIVDSGLGVPLPGKTLGEVWKESFCIEQLSCVREFARRSVLCEHWTVVC